MVILAIRLHEVYSKSDCKDKSEYTNKFHRGLDENANNVNASHGQVTGGDKPAAKLQQQPTTPVQPSQPPSPPDLNNQPSTHKAKTATSVTQFTL